MSEIAARLAALDVAGITADSRAVRPGFVFAALPGARQDGRRFIAEAVARGACAVLAPAGTPWPPAVPPRPLIEDAEPRRRLAQIAAALAGPQPATIAAVTGTNGKTSTVEFLRQIWEGAGRRAASLGTLGLHGTGLDDPGTLTTPDPVRLAALLARLHHQGVERLAMEASSHGLDQCRLDGVRLSAAAFTNLTRDHLDYHGTLDAYRAAKLRLFAALLPPGALAIAAWALDDTSFAALAEIARARRLDLRRPASLRAVMARPDGQDIEIEVAGRRRVLPLAVPGRFQAENALLAAALAEAAGERDALDRLPSLTGVRGRLERAAVLGNGAAVYVDYAHTPDALARLLAALRPHTPGRLHVVFGAGGDRDPGKRPLMGRAAAEGADVVVVTDDNPRSEDAAAIRAAVLGGCGSGRDGGAREDAIATAMSDLQAGDVLVVAGKGHEQGQTIGETIIPFDDASVIRRLAGIAA